MYAPNEAVSIDCARSASPRPDGGTEGGTKRQADKLKNNAISRLAK